MCSDTLMTNPPLLIENWLPIDAIGAESKRERGASSALPPLYFLHVWWARRPLTTSRAAILASVLPQWSPDWPAKLHEKFPNEKTYQQWFSYLIGIRGDPVNGRKLVDWAKARGIQLDSNPYGGAPRAFTVNPSADDLQTMGDLFEYTWGTRELSVLDPFAGGGSIPFEALRYGFTTIANDLNPVAAVILKATLDYPARFGPSLAEDLRKWGNEWAKKVKEKLEPYFPKQLNESIFAYLWARTVACPTTGKPVPLSPNWWLRTGSDPVAVKLIAEEGMDRPQFEIVTGKQATLANPDVGTITRGVGRSPWTGETISGDYIKAEAQAGRMEQMLYAVAIKKSGGFGFRAPTPEDLEAVRCAEEALAKKKPEWIAKGIIPTEEIPDGNKTSELRRYGMFQWKDVFTPRQLLVLGTYLECLHQLSEELHDETVGNQKSTMLQDRANAITSYLAIALSKCPNYNARIASWHAPRAVMRSVFDRHDFAFAWSHGEFDGASNLLPWAINQIVDAYKGMAELSAPAQATLQQAHVKLAKDRSKITRGSAITLSECSDNSIVNITVDPPYYDNVQYAELSDFFYVWLKRSVGHLFPEFFRDELTNKDDEAVANPARFESMGRKKKELAEHDYQLKMAAAFREMYRVLRPDGALTVMFTHKRVEAWDTLASALIGAGFTIKASWPVHTESEHSLHQAKKNAASSTILLVCRKRQEKGEREQAAWWDDLKPIVRRTARVEAEKFAAQGIGGADLYISTFGPTLSIISEHWPVLTSETDPKTGQPKPLRPEIALDLAREEVVRLRKQGLLLGRDVQFDPVTDWYLMAWDSYGAEQFPYDEARKLAIALGLDLEHTLMQTERLITKKGEFVVLQAPALRRRKGMVDDTLTSFEYLIDAVHTAMMVYDEDGSGACDVFLRNTGLKNDGAFKACLQALINAIPRSRVKGKFVRPEAEMLENMRLAFFDDLQAPVEPGPPALPAKQMGLGEGFNEEEGSEEEEGEEG
jgi:putative DNA methylase